jgi:hypothetical protein
VLIIGFFFDIIIYYYCFSEYSVVFTPNREASLRIIGEFFPFSKYSIFLEFESGMTVTLNNTLRLKNNLSGLKKNENIFRKSEDAKKNNESFIFYNFGVQEIDRFAHQNNASITPSSFNNLQSEISKGLLIPPKLPKISDCIEGEKEDDMNELKSKLKKNSIYYPQNPKINHLVYIPSASPTTGELLPSGAVKWVMGYSSSIMGEECSNGESEGCY